MVVRLVLDNLNTHKGALYAAFEPFDASPNVVSHGSWRILLSLPKGWLSELSVISLNRRICGERLLRERNAAKSDLEQTLSSNYLSDKIPSNGRSLSFADICRSRSVTPSIGYIQAGTIMLGLARIRCRRVLRCVVLGM